MLVDLSNAVGGYLHQIFIQSFDGWVALGFLGQIFFTARFLVQWIVSERQGRSVVPLAFWFFSIGGGLLLFIYASIVAIRSLFSAKAWDCSSTSAISC